MPKLEMIPGLPIGKHVNGTFYYRASTPGLGEKIVSLGTRNEKEARKLYREVEQGLLREADDYVPGLYADIAREAFQVRMKENRASTAYQARHIYDKLIKAFGHLPIEQVNDARWIAQVEKWQQSTERTAFMNVRKYAVQIDNYAFRKGYKKTRCDFPISDPKKREGRVLTDSEFTKAIDACRNWYVDGVKVAPRRGIDIELGWWIELFLIMARTMGMRRSEITQLSFARIDLVARSITLAAEDTKTGSKTGKGRQFGISPEAYPLLVEARRKSTSHWLFPNDAGTGPVQKAAINRRILRISRAIGIEFKPHDLRHTFLTQKLCVEKVDAMAVAIYAGVSLEVIQSTYLHPKVDDTRHVVESQAVTPPRPNPTLTVITGGAV